MAFFASLEDVQNGASQLADTAKGVASAVGDAVCSVYASNPGALLNDFNLIPGVSDITRAIRKGFLDNLCGNRNPAPVPGPLPSVTGGQCVGAQYRVQFFSGRRTCNPQQTFAEFLAADQTGPGPVSITYVTTAPGPNCGVNGARINFGSNQGSIFGIGSNNAWNNPRIVITPVGAAPNNCGNGIPIYPPDRIPPSFPINNIKNITNNYSDTNNFYNITVPITNIQPIVNVNPQLNVSPRFNVTLAPDITLELGPGGLTTIDPPGSATDLTPVLNLLNAILANTNDIESELTQQVTGEIELLECDGTSSETAISGKPLQFLASALLEINQVQNVLALRDCEVPMALVETTIGSFDAGSRVVISSNAKKVRIQVTAFGPNISKVFSPGGNAPISYFFGKVALDYLQGVSVTKDINWEDSIFDIDDTLTAQAVIVKSFLGVEYTVSEFVEEVI